MAAGKGRFITVLFAYLSLPVPTVTEIVDVCILRGVNAFFHPRQLVCTPYRHLVKLSVTYAKTHFSVLLRAEHHKVCPF